MTLAFRYAFSFLKRLQEERERERIREGGKECDWQKRSREKIKKKKKATEPRHWCIPCSEINLVSCQEKIMVSVACFLSHVKIRPQFLEGFVVGGSAGRRRKMCMKP